jgi:hypothetical protein
VTPAEIGKAIEASWATFLTKNRRQSAPHLSVYASAYRECDRRMVLEASRPQELPEWPAETLARFRRGQDRERDVLADLTRIGRDAEPAFAVIGQQERFELKDRRGRTAIVGKVDARLAVNGQRAPLEVKAWAPFITDKLETFADVFNNPWTQHGAYQLLSYLYGASEPFGFLLLDRPGIPRLLPVELDAHLEEMEAFLVKAERILDHLEAGTLPDYLDDPIECKRCPLYGALCNPPLSAEGAQILTDPELEAALKRRELLKAGAKEYLDLDDEVKARLRGVTSGIIGPFQILGRWQKRSYLELPPALKKQYTKTNDRGQFRIEITQLTETKTDDAQTGSGGSSSHLF